MIEALEEFNRKYAGATKAGTLATLPPNTDVVDMGMNIVDVDFINTLKFNATQIAALYGVPAHMVGILEQTKFASVETTLLDFKASTLAAIGRMYRQEMEAKLLTTAERIAGKSIEFNWNALVEVDSVSRINNLKTLQGMGVVTANDVAKLEGFATYEGGDVHIVPGNYVPVDQLGKKPSSNV
jgi:HK97 family phage portal protein